MTRIFTSDFRENRPRPQYPDPFPVHKLKRVDRPTTFINDAEVQQRDERTSGFFKALNGDYGTQIQKEFKRSMGKDPLAGSMTAIKGSLSKIVDGPGAPDQIMDSVERIETDPAVSKLVASVAEYKAPSTDDPEAMALHIKETAYFLRSDLVGICRLPKYAVYSHQKPDGKKVTLNHQYAIAILIDQDWYTSSATTGSDWISNSMSNVAYSTAAFIACILADYIRRLGYPARAHMSMNYQVVVPPILLWAGLGEMSRIGDIVINPFLGPRFKAAVVTTDLPLAVDKPIDFGLQDFCDRCVKCADECPSNAINRGDKIMRNGYEKWPINVERCTKMRTGNKRGSGCGTCIKVCPWNKPRTLFHRATGWSMINIPFLRRFGVWGDNLLGYGKPDYKRKWWLDLVKKDGKLVVPSLGQQTDDLLN